MAVLKTLTVNGVTYTVTPLVSNVQVRADAWEGSDGAYYQVVDVPGATANCKVNLQLTPEQVVEFGEQDIYFTTENNLGVVTIHAIGDKPLKDYSFQTTVTVVTDAYKDEGGNVVVGGGGSGGGDGFSPVAKVTQTEEGAVITITDKSGTTTATIFNGPDGKDYILTEADKQEIAEQASQMVKVPEDGKDGTSVTVKSVSESTADGGSNVVTFSDGKTITIKNGKAGTPGKTPVKGTDYWREEDKAEMVNEVIAALPVYNGEVV